MTLEDFNPEEEINRFLHSRNEEVKGSRPAMQYLNDYADLIMQIADKWQSFHLIQIPDVTNAKHKLEHFKASAGGGMENIEDSAYQEEWNAKKEKLDSIKNRLVQACKENIL